MNFYDIKNQRKIHFIGLGGIGMSALAFILRKWDIEVQGSDLRENYLTEKLRKQKVTYFVGHDSKNISDDISLIVQTSIIKSDNPEILAAKSKGIEIISRADLLAIIMSQYKGITIAGTHGKTSTTAMVAVMLEINGLDPTVVNGGTIHYFNSNSKVGKGKYLVAESDESDASFVKLPSFIGAVTNIEPEHLEFVGYQGSFEKQKSYFEKYVEQIPSEGTCVLCFDDLEVRKIYKKFINNKQNLLCYSIKEENKSNVDAFACNIVTDVSGLSFDVILKDGSEIKNIKMPIYGEHNASNALVAVLVAKFLGLNNEQIKKGLLAFNGVKQRFTKVGEFKGVAIIDDYGHHPTEIATTLKAARKLAGKHKVICVFQPHKPTRVRDLFNEFACAFSDSDCVIVCDIYSAGQQPIEGINQDALVSAIAKNKNLKVIKLLSEKDLAKVVKSQIDEKNDAGSLVFCTGAGTISAWAAKLEEQLKNL